MAEETEAAGSVAGAMILLGGGLTALLMIIFGIAFILAAL